MDFQIDTWSGDRARAHAISISRRFPAEGGWRVGGNITRVLTLYDVDFAAVRPRTGFAPRPKGRPGATTSRHVLEIEHEYRFVVRVLRRDADAVASAGGGGNDGPIVGTHEELPAVNRNKKFSESRTETRRKDRTICQVFSLSLCLANVVDAAVRRVIPGHPVPPLEEPLADPLILEIEGCPGAWSER